MDQDNIGVEATPVEEQVAVEAEGSVDEQAPVEAAPAEVAGEEVNEDSEEVAA